MAARADAGLLYARPRLAVGWGRALHSWVGLEGGLDASLLQLAGYGGLRVAWPWLSLHVGVRRVLAFEDRYLTPHARYDRVRPEEDEELARGSYTAPEATLSWTVPVPRAVVFGALSAHALLGVPDDVYVYEQRHRVIVAPPCLARARLGAGPYLGARRIAYLGVTAEALWLADRDDYVLRAGLVVRIRPTAALEIRATFLPAVRSPDSLGIRGGDFSELGIRYLWSKHNR